MYAGDPAGRFSMKIKGRNVASLSHVDYVCIVDDEIPFECVKRIKPDVFAKASPIKNGTKKYIKRYLRKKGNSISEKSKIYETDGFSFSSSQIINNFLYVYPDETKNYLKNFSKVQLQ